MEAYRISTVAAMLDSTEDTILREIQRGRLGAIRVGVQWRITDAQLAAYVEAQTCHDEPKEKATSRGTPNAKNGGRRSLSPQGERERAILEAGLKRKQERDAKRKAGAANRSKPSAKDAT